MARAPSRFSTPTDTTRRGEGLRLLPPSSWAKGRNMPISTATVGTVDQVVAELEQDGHQIVQLFTVDGTVKILYRTPKWEVRA